LRISFYRCTIESILTYCCTVWHSSCTATDKKGLQQVVKTAERIVGCPLPNLSDIHSSRLLTRRPQRQTSCRTPHTPETPSSPPSPQAD
ncbi:hypothetical protein LDENG_00005020, partial [Lucifuga dentata]